MMRAFRDEDHAAIQQGLEKVGLQKKGAHVPDQDELYREIRSSFGPFLFEDGVFEFDKTVGHEIFMRLLAKGLRRPGQFQPSASILFTDRAQTGHFMNMMKMRACFNMHRIYEPYLALPQLGDEGFEARMRTVPERPPV